MEIPLSQISDFPNHPFKVKMDESMSDLVESVKSYGVLSPVIVRPKDNGEYEMIAGHRRKRASELAGKENIKCIVQDVTDDEAIILMVDSNLQREQLLPSEKAFAYKMKLDAMKRQGYRSDLTSATPLQKYGNKTSREIIAKQSGESHEQIRKYIRLTYLSPSLLDMVDEGKIAMRPAVELSYLTENEQEILLNTMEWEDCTPSHVQAIKMRQFSQEGKLNEGVIQSILQEEKPNQKEQFRMPKERISKYFAPGTSSQKIEETIIKALELYRKRQREAER
ncbi:MAG: ParB/RepB/Spo0J family partition protein [Oscillospiraceae bacterium]|nr:ParB/RepB/Spo0J family partition protein [Oscillospiraceae bacterium]